MAGPRADPLPVPDAHRAEAAPRHARRRRRLRRSGDLPSAERAGSDWFVGQAAGRSRGSGRSSAPHAVGAARRPGRRSRLGRTRCVSSRPGNCRAPVQHRTWNLSCIWSIPVRDSAGSRGRLWLKCVPGFFAHEACVLRRLSAEAVPRLAAAQDHRLLLGDLPGRDGFNATPDEAKQVIEALVGLQIRTLPLVLALLGDGVPDARGKALIQQLQAVVARRAPDNPILRELADWAAPGSLEALVCRVRLIYHAFLACVVAFLEFFRRNIPACRVKALRVVPRHPFEASEHDVIDAAPRPFPLDELFLVKAVQRLGCCVIIGITLPAHRTDCADLTQPPGIGNGRVLDGFKGSSQQCR